MFNILLMGDLLGEIEFHYKHQWEVKKKKVMGQ